MKARDIVKGWPVPKSTSGPTLENDMLRELSFITDAQHRIYHYICNPLVKEWKPQLYDYLVTEVEKAKEENRYGNKEVLPQKDWPYLRNEEKRIALKLSICKDSVYYSYLLPDSFIKIVKDVK